MTENNQVYIDDVAIEKAEDYRQRKTTSVLTIIFTDIAQSTYLREKLGEVDYEQQREEHDETIQQIIQADDAGAVLKSTGDGILANNSQNFGNTPCPNEKKSREFYFHPAVENFHELSIPLCSEITSGVIRFPNPISTSRWM